MRQICEQLVCALVVLCLLGLSTVPVFAENNVTISPTAWNFGIESVGLKTGTVDIQVTNNANRPVTVTGFSLSNPAFQLTQGIAPIIVPKGTPTHFTIIFAPTAEGVATGTFSVTIRQLHDPLTVSLKGTGRISNAVASVSTQAIDFGSLEEGQTSTAQTVTLVNTGTQMLGLTDVTVDPPFFTSPITPTTLRPRQSLSFDVFFAPSKEGSFLNTLVLVFDSVPNQGIDLSGVGAPASTLAVTTFSTLPSATQNAAYLAFLAGAGGTLPYTWSVQDGSSLPSGLALASDGTVSGTVASSVSAGTYSFTAQVSDSSVPPLVSSRAFNVLVGAPTGALCDNIFYNVPGTSTPILGLDVLGTGTYLGAMGGLYFGGSNIRPASHDAAGVSIAQGIQPLDADGNFDPNGKEVVLIVGESNVHIEGERIVRNATASPSRNPTVLVADGGQGNATAGNLADVNSPFWTTMTDYILPNWGVTAKQVVAAWVEPDDALNSGTFPTDITRLRGDIQSEVQNLLVHFPNIKLAYLSSRMYSGYSNGLNTINPEPYAYEASFAVKGVIQNQINGDPSLNYDPGKGTVMAPWIAWGPYTWANGLTVPSANGSVWSCQDIKNDGTHPSITTGAEEVANQVLNYLKTDTTATPWFLKH